MPRLLLALCPLGLFLASCNSTYPDTPPEVWMNRIVPMNMTMMTTQFDGNVRIENEDIEPIHVVGAVHRFYINGRFLGKGMTSEPLTVPPLGSANQNVLVNASNLRFATQFHDLLQGPTYDYALQSTLHLARGNARPRKVRVTNEGRIDLRNLNLTR